MDIGSLLGLEQLTWGTLILVVIAAVTADGACGHCFGMIPLQQQTEIRQARDLTRCEACGVILMPAS